MPNHYPGIDVDEFVVMPNHIHGIILLVVGATPRGCPEFELGRARWPAPTNGANRAQGHAQEHVLARDKMSLPDVVHRFKSLTTARYRRGVYRNGWRPFPGRLWQRNYYEHIIRNEDELSLIRRYIRINPLKWEYDCENPFRLIDEDYERNWGWVEKPVGTRHSRNSSPLRKGNRQAGKPYER